MEWQSDSSKFRWSCSLLSSKVAVTLCCLLCNVSLTSSGKNIEKPRNHESPDLEDLPVPAGFDVCCKFRSWHCQTLQRPNSGLPFHRIACDLIGILQRTGAGGRPYGFVDGVASDFLQLSAFLQQCLPQAGTERISEEWTPWTLERRFLCMLLEGKSMAVEAGGLEYLRIKAWSKVWWSWSRTRNGLHRELAPKKLCVSQRASWKDPKKLCCWCRFLRQPRMHLVIPPDALRLLARCRETWRMRKPVESLDRLSAVRTGDSRMGSLKASTCLPSCLHATWTISAWFGWKNI